MSTIWIAAAIIVIVVLRRIAPIAGSAFAVVVAMGVGAWGFWAYNHGGGVGLVFSKQQVPQSAFYVIIAFWFAVELYGLVRNIQRRPEATAADREGE